MDSFRDRPQPRMPLVLRRPQVAPGVHPARQKGSVCLGASPGVLPRGSVGPAAQVGAE